ncbi:MAG: anti-sigma factor [Polyangiaceae bacterium]
MTDLTPHQEAASDHALGQLDRPELDEFLASLGDADSPTDHELAAAELEVALLGLGGEGAERLPQQLEGRLKAAATAYAWALDSKPANRVELIAERRDPGVDLVRYLGWMAAAAALVVVWFVLGKRSEPQVSVTPPPEPPSAVPSVPAPPPTPEEQRAELLKHEDARKLAWSATKDEAAKGASGDVVWSSHAQQGYMRFKGLEPNDPKRSQYQLWIFSKDQDERYPVDGGVFDVDSSGEVVVAIDPKLHVDEPTLFAITVEKPGGVVVSKRERIVLTASAGG